MARITARSTQTAAFAGLLLLAACGGGGGDTTVGTGTNPAPDTNPDTLGLGFVQSFAAFEAAAANLRNNVTRYVNQRGFVDLFNHPRTPINEAGNYLSYPLASARVEYAHAAGLTGAGQTIAIVDAGFRQSHDAFAGKPTTEIGNPAVDDHGTMVASVAAGNSATMVGVAPGANLSFGNWDTPTEATIWAFDNEILVQNNSWGYTGSTATQSSFNFFFRSDPDGVAYLDALRDYAAVGVVVFAVENDETNTRAGLMEALPLFDASLHAGWLAVANAVPIYTETDITGAGLVSSGCFEAARWCLLADGFWYAANATSDSTYEQVTGSSFATPMVSGAMALLAEAFPTLTPHQLRLRLLASADNTFTGFTSAGQVELATGFFHDYSTLYGHGFLDLRAALLPIGQTTLSLNDGTLVKTSDVGFSTGAAMGDAVARGLEGIDLAVSDSLNGGFKLPGKAIAAPSAPAPLGDGLLSRTLASDFTARRTARSVNPRASFADHSGRTLELADADTGLRTALLMPEEGSTAGEYGVALTQPLLSGPLKLDVGLKVARDDGSLLGFGSENDAPGAALAAVGLTLSREYEGGGFIALQAEMGVADLGTPLAISEASRVGFDSFGLSVGRRGVFKRGDRLALGVSLPTAVTSGRATLDLQVAREDGSPEARSVGFDLAPSERQVDMSISYQMPLGRQSEMHFEVLHADNYGNQAGLSDTAGVLAVRFRF